MPTPPPPSSLKPSTPINTRRMQALLCDHPDPAFVDFVINGLSHGFDIGYQEPRRRTSSPSLPSALSHPDFISTYLYAACLRQETAGRYPTPPFTDLHCSGLGVVPKKNGKLRPIHHVSTPFGPSVNDGIPSDKFRLHYVSVDNAISLITRHERGVHFRALHDPYSTSAHCSIGEMQIVNRPRKKGPSKNVMLLSQGRM